MMSPLLKRVCQFVDQEAVSIERLRRVHAPSEKYVVLYGKRTRVKCRCGALSKGVGVYSNRLQITAEVVFHESSNP